MFIRICIHKTFVLPPACSMSVLTITIPSSHSIETHYQLDPKVSMSYHIELPTEDEIIPLINLQGIKQVKHIDPIPDYLMTPIHPTWYPVVVTAGGMVVMLLFFFLFCCFAHHRAMNRAQGSHVQHQCQSANIDSHKAYPLGIIQEPQYN